MSSRPSPPFPPGGCLSPANVNTINIASIFEAHAALGAKQQGVLPAAV
jgi:hypothetical protein